MLYCKLRNEVLYTLNSIYADAVKKNRKLILSANDYLWRNAESGYREV